MVANLIPPPDDVGCPDDSAWVTDPNAGLGQCQRTDDLVACCFQPQNSRLPLACRAGVPTECAGDHVCSRTGFCYERTPPNMGIPEADLQRDPVASSPPGLTNPPAINRGGSS